MIAAAGFITPAFAQRGDRHSGGNQGGGSRQSFSTFHQNNVTPRQNNSFSTRSFSTRQDRPSNFTQPRQNVQNMTRDNRSYSSSFSSRTRSDNNNAFIQRNNRISYPNTTTRVNNSFRSNNGNRYDFGRRGYYNNYNRYGYSHYSYAPRRYEYGGYRHYSILPRSFISISFGGYPYWYDSGLFYSYYNGFYEPVYAPFGICVRTLPYGYYPFYWGGVPYYYYDGTYYRDHGDSEYEVVDAPIGAVVTELPKGAKAVTVNGEKFYEFNGTYYKEGTNDKNEVEYTVVGKNGEVNNSDDPNVNANQQPPLQIGDIVSTLPDNCRQVTINGQTLYVSPDNFYFKQRTTTDGTTSYEVVGSDEK